MRRAPSARASLSNDQAGRLKGVYAVGANVVTNPHVLKASIDTLKGLVPIIQTTDYQYVLAVNPRVRPTTSRN